MASDTEPSGDELVEKVGKDLAGAMGELAELAATVEQQSRAVRRRIVSDVRRLMESHPDSTEAQLAETLVAVANRYAAELGVSTSPSDAIVPLDKPVFGVSSGCLGRPGGGISADFGSVSVSMCVAGSLQDGITGGGFEISVEY